MEIVIFIGGLSDGGAERVASNLCNYLSKSHDVTVLTMSNEPAVYQLNENIRRMSLTKVEDSDHYFVRNIKRIARFRKFIKDSSADVFLVMLPVTINIMLSHRRRIKAPVIVSERCDPQTRFENSKLKKWFMRRLYPKADGFVFQTEQAKAYYDKYIGGRGVVIPNAINKEFIRKPYTGKRKKVIAAAGRLTNQKNFLLLLEAFSRISQKHADYDLVIYGNGPQRGELEKRIEELKLRGRVLMPGYVNDFGDRIVNASLFVQSSDFEGMPNALMEAMALGVPCISTDCPAGGPGYLIDHGDNGLLVPVGDAARLAEAMDRVLSDKKFAERMGDHARGISDTLSPDKIYGEWERYLCKIHTQTQNS